VPTKNGALRIFSLLGIGVYVHWSWFLVAIYSVQYRTHEYDSMVWNVAEYLALFLIVLTHEFGHQLACRQVGGQTHDIVLWPLGGVAYVSAPQRPGAELWSIAAGPLVNVILIPVLTGLIYFGKVFGWFSVYSSSYELLKNVWTMNIGILIFNLLPIYPLDGGQILRSLLWFIFGRANSLLAASIIGLIGVVGLVGLAIYWQSLWGGVMAVFILMNCWRGLKHARALARIAKIPRRSGFACPSCKSAPPLGAVWRCGKCGMGFDTFLTSAICPQCNTQFPETQCLDCGVARPIQEWCGPVPPPLH
jgi:Zn-dependent protease